MKDTIGYIEITTAAIHSGHSSARLVQLKAQSDICDAPHMGPPDRAAEALQEDHDKHLGDGSSQTCSVMVFYLPKDSSFKRQASSPKHKGSSLKPQATSSWTLLPSKSFKHPEPRCWMQMKVFCGCFTWNAIWCGEKRILLLFVTFSSTVKKVPELL